jgi:hypothetical protein
LLVGERVDPGSLYAILFREGDRLFPDQMFADLFDTVGRWSVPPRIVATVMVLQRAYGLSDREAVDRFEFDNRWKYACGGLDVDYPGFGHTVLVGMRARLRASLAPDRVFDVVLDVARQAGLVGRKRVLDSTCLFDAVATMDTFSLVRSAIRGVLAVVDEDVANSVRAVLVGEDVYSSGGKPVCEWNDTVARERVIDQLVRDAVMVLTVLDGMELSPSADQAAQLLAMVAGQDVEQGCDGVFRIARRVGADRVISTVDPDTRHGHKTSSQRFDGYKAHIAIDPDSEIITAARVTTGNVGDGSVALNLIVDVVPLSADTATVMDGDTTCEPIPDDPMAGGDCDDDRVVVYGDASYGTGPVLAVLHAAGVDVKCKVPLPVNKNGLFTKEQFSIDLDAGQVTCPGGHVKPIRWNKNGDGDAGFGRQCGRCPLMRLCTTAKNGRTIRIDKHEFDLGFERERQKDPAWVADYNATRPKVERRLSHLVSHGNRRARLRGQQRVDADFRMLVAARNLIRLAVLGVHTIPGGGWVLA